MNSNTKIIVIVLAICLTVNTAGAFEFATNRGLGMAQTVLFSEPSASTLLLLPSTSIEKGELIVELGGMREFEIKELDRAYVAAATRFGSYTLSIGVSQLGERDYYAERTGKISLAYHYFDYAFAVSISGIDYSFGGNYDSQRAGTAGASFSYHYRRLYIGASIDNINSPKLIESSPAINPQYSIYAEVVGNGAFSLTARGTFEKDQAMQLALGQKIEVSNRGSVFWGFNTEPFQFGGGVDIWYNGQGAITYAGSYHPTLGFSHNLSISYHFGRLKKPDDTFQ